MSYTEELTKQIVKEYEAEPTRETVDAIAGRIGKTSRSVIAKLAAVGVYRTPQRTTKTGDPIVKKEEMVADLEEILGVTLETLVKSGKQDLQKLLEAVRKLDVGQEDS